MLNRIEGGFYIMSNNIKTLLEQIEAKYNGPIEPLIRAKANLNAGVDYSTLGKRLQGFISQKLYESLSSGSVVDVDGLCENIIGIIREEMDERELVKHEKGDKDEEEEVQKEATDSDNDNEAEFRQDDDAVTESLEEQVNAILEELEGEEEKEKDGSLEEEINQIFEDLEDEGEGSDEADEQEEPECIPNPKFKAKEAPAEEVPAEEEKKDDEDLSLEDQINTMLDELLIEGEGEGEEEEEKDEPAMDELEDEEIEKEISEILEALDKDDDEEKKPETVEESLSELVSSILEELEDDKDNAEDIVNEMKEGAEEEESVEDIEKKVESVLESRGINIGSNKVKALTEALVNSILKDL